MMDGGHYFGGGGFMWIIWLLVIVGFIFLIKSFTSGNNQNINTNKNDDALEILNKRLAKGEISEAEYQRLKKNIESQLTKNCISMNKFKSVQYVSALFFIMSINISYAENSEEIYMQNCLLCHGDDAKGAMPGVPDLREEQSWSKKSPNELLNLIKKGIEKPGSSMVMPPKGGNNKLTDNQLNKSIEYMRTLLLDKSK